MKVHVKKSDTVLVINGKDKSKTGEVLSVNPKEGKIIVRGVNMVLKHQKATRQNNNSAIIKKEAPIYSSKVMLYCNKCKKPTRISHKIEDGKKIRVCKHCGVTL